MRIEEVKKELEKERSKISVRGPISETPEFEIWGEINLTSFDAKPISWNRVCDGAIEIRMNAFASGSALSPPYLKYIE